MEIYKTNNKNIFFTFINIDNKRIELDFVLTVQDLFYCNIFVSNKEDAKKGTYQTIEQFSFRTYNFTKTQEEINKFLTDRQIDMLRKAIKKAYSKILKIKFEEITQGNFVINEKQIAEYEIFRKHIDHI